MNKNVALTLALVLAVSVLALAPVRVEAQSKIVVVPDDYPTITAALGNATTGETILVRSGTYNEETLQTNLTVSLIGQGSASTIVNLHPPSVPIYILGQYVGKGATAVNFDADNLVMAGLTINSYGGDAFNGNHMILTCNVLNNYAQSWFNVQGSDDIISNCTSNTVINIECTNSQVYGNNGTGSIIVSSFAQYNTIFDNQVTSLGDNTLESDNLYYGNVVHGGGGIFVTDDDIVADNTITDCSQGVNLEQSSNNVVVGNLIEDNHGPAIALTGYVEGELTNPSFNNLIYANYIAGNSVGVFAATSSQWHGANFTIYDNDFVGNFEQAQIIMVDPTTTASNENYRLSLYPQSDNWSLGGQGNYWSDYLQAYPNASEVGSSGIGDTPYIVAAGEQDNYPLLDEFNIPAIAIQLPPWANITPPTPLSTYAFPSEISAECTSTPASAELTSPSPAQASPIQSTEPATQSPEAQLPIAAVLVLAVSVALVVLSNRKAAASRLHG